jgi:hypothetical protein
MHPKLVRKLSKKPNKFLNLPVVQEAPPYGGASETRTGTDAVQI